MKFNNSLSRSFLFFQGVPQFSVLSPTLFSIYVPGIENVIKRKCEIKAFMVNIVHWKPDSDWTKLEIDINLVLEDLRNFVLDHKPTFNPTKSMALGSLTSLPNGKEIWILSDSRSAMQHSSNWQSVRDNVGESIITKLIRLYTSHQIHLQWILYQVDLEGNEIADILVKSGACEVPETSAPFTFWRLYPELITRIRPRELSPRAPLVLVFLSWRLSGARFYQTGSNSSSPLSKWPP
ncbi:RNase H domain-containing protein [Trichonephila clavipes]|nr:RNase H domain-containing protein [Trichonephila clavipes]